MGFARAGAGRTAPPTPDEIADAFIAEAASQHQISTKLDRGGSWRRLVRDNLPPGKSIGNLVNDREALVGAIKEAISAETAAAEAKRNAEERRKREGAEKAKSGEWVLVIHRKGGIYHSWIDDRWFDFDRRHYRSRKAITLWDGIARMSVLGYEITKEQACEALMKYEEELPF